MAEILLTSESFVKSVTNVSDNLAGKYILPSIREAQEQGLKGILGDCLLTSVKERVKDNSIDNPENIMYKALVEHCQYYLAYLAIVEVTNKVSYKIGNFGVTKSTDENLQVATYDEIVKMQYYYQSKVDAYCIDLQTWILDNKDAFPELTPCQCHKISSNLHSAASCGIFLGGARGKKRR